MKPLVQCIAPKADHDGTFLASLGKAGRNVAVLAAVLSHSMWARWYPADNIPAGAHVAHAPANRRA